MRECRHVHRYKIGYLTVLRNLDPELASGIVGRAKTVWSVESLAARRADRTAAAAAHTDPPNGVDISEISIPSSIDGELVKLRIFRPSSQTAPLPALYWIHGGGMVLGSVEHDDPFLCEYVDQLDCVVVAVDYRVAPEYPFPVPVQDCYDGLVYAAEHATDLGLEQLISRSPVLAPEVDWQLPRP